MGSLVEFFARRGGAAQTAAVTWRRRVWTAAFQPFLAAWRASSLAEAKGLAAVFDTDADAFFVLFAASQLFEAYGDATPSPAEGGEEALEEALVASVRRSIATAVFAASSSGLRGGHAAIRASLRPAASL